jgi:cellulose synthase/poly-beta-1,6-N-acetylglucosamine synthase-like glycosyltransferase
VSLFISFFLCSLALLLAIPATIFTLEVIAALVLPARRQNALDSGGANRRSVAILVPAHNESTGILKTLNDIDTQLRPGDRVLVVADNCVDDTAPIAAAAGAEVIERKDLTKTGKGYALEFGLKHLNLNPPATVVVIDADCRIAEHTIDRLARLCEVTHRPAQALNLMVASDGSPINYCVAEFAWRVKNWVRPLGLDALNLPCHLMGTGMAIPWEAINSTKLASGSVVEDLKLGLDLAQLGRPPLFCPSALVISHFPLSVEGAASQRKRWDGGHITTILASFPRLIYTALAHKNWSLLALALDMAVPPLSMFVVLLSGMFFTTALAAIFGSASALIITVATMLIFASGIIFSWINYGRDVLPPTSILSIARYVFLKLPIYYQILFRRTSLQWKRTDRKKSA